MQVEFTVPKDSKEILAHIETLTFRERLQYGADIGRKCENADELIQQLRNVCALFIARKSLHSSLHAICMTRTRRRPCPIWSWTKGCAR